MLVDGRRMHIIFCFAKTKQKPEKRVRGKLGDCCLCAGVAPMYNETANKYLQKTMKDHCSGCCVLLIILFLGVKSQQGVDKQYKCDWQLDLVNRHLGIVTKYVTPDNTLFEDVTSQISNVDLTPDDSEVVSNTCHV